MDFKHRFPGHENRLFVEWSNIFRSVIINLARKKHVSVINQFLAIFNEHEQKDYQQRQGLLKNTCFHNVKPLLQFLSVFDHKSAFFLFPLLYPNISRHKKKSIIQKQSKIEMVQSFVTYIDVTFTSHSGALIMYVIFTYVTFQQEDYLNFILPSRLLYISSVNKINA